MSSPLSCWPLPIALIEPEKAKIIERKDIPSYEAMTDDMARVQIQEFWNPKITAESNLTGTNVDVRKEQEKILLRKIDRFVKPMSLTLKGKSSKITYSYMFSIHELGTRSKWI